MTSRDSILIIICGQLNSIQVFLAHEQIISIQLNFNFVLKHISPTFSIQFSKTSSKMSSKTAIAFNELYGRSSGKSKRLAALGRTYAKTAPALTNPTPIIRISPPTPTKEMASNMDQVQ